jgi:hypothetical protein
MESKQRPLFLVDEFTLPQARRPARREAAAAGAQDVPEVS